MTAVFTILTGVAVVVLLAVDDRQLPRAIAKTIASAGFIAVGASADAASSGYGRWVLVALVLSAVGDVALLGRAKGPFLAGLGAFLAAHLAYSVSFAVRGVSLVVLGVTAVPLAGAGLLVSRRLLPSVPGRLRGPVVAYAAAISAMAALAAATSAHEPTALIPIAAVAFYASDLAVARDRFVSPGFVNRLWGLPLYYGAQLLFSWSVT